ncbi:MAG: ComF family protein [Boseongicola sp.]|nr:MAG: ComF family protein [Boseongicola sp.]
MSLMQRALTLIYPDQCILCTDLVERRGALCARCWKDTPFLTGHGCDRCGAPLVGVGDGGVDHCDDCIKTAPPWRRGRAVARYDGNARRIVLALKHGDRLDLVPTIAGWMARAGKDLLTERPVIVPVPSHWSRLLKRRFNQATEVTRSLAKLEALPHCPDALVRTRITAVQDGKGPEERFQNIANAITANPKRLDRLGGKKVCLVDDVMTSGATLSAATNACYAAGADQVSVLVLARVTKAT